MERHRGFGKGEGSEIGPEAVLDRVRSVAGGHGDFNVDYI